MIVHEPEITEHNGEIQISSRIEIRNSAAGFPDRLWFRFPEAYREYVTDRSDAFAVTLLPLAMDLGVPLRIRGVVSPRLALGMAEYQRIQTTWHPDRLKMVEMDFVTLEDAELPRLQGGIATAFSGGVDSFYTIHSHVLEEPIQNYRISHCLMINGFDFNNDDIEDCTAFNQITDVYRPMLKALDVQLLVAHTNSTPFFAPSLRAWNLHGFAHGALLTASALALGKLLRCLFIPSGRPYSKLIPWGSHPMLDHLLSSETMETRHDGAKLSRFEKEAVFAHWPEVHSRLRVCNNRTTVNPKTGALENCCRCEKCLRTIVGLDLHVGVAQFTAFPEGLKRGNLLRMAIPSILRKNWLDLCRQAFQRGRLVLCLDIILALQLSPLRKAKRRLLATLKGDRRKPA